MLHVYGCFGAGFIPLSCSWVTAIASPLPPPDVVGLPGLMPLPWWQTLAIFAYAMAACLAVNDAVKVAIIKWLVPSVAA